MIMRKKIYSIFVGLLIFFNAIKSFERNNCCQPCFFGSCAPLYCKEFDAQIQGGVAPIVWKDLGDVFVISCPSIDDMPLVRVFDFPKFNKFFHVPWTIGAQIGYAYSENVRFYVEFNYIQAQHKGADSTTFSFMPPAMEVPEGIMLNFKLRNNYRLFNFHIGSRYYSNRICDFASLFIGAKVGFNHHKKTLFSLTVTVPGVGLITLIPDSSNASLFKQKTSVSGGINFGLDFAVTNNISAVLTGEVIATCGPKTTTSMFNPSFPIPTTNISMNPIGTELQFPVTAAIRYNF